MILIDLRKESEIELDATVNCASGLNFYCSLKNVHCRRTFI